MLLISYLVLNFLIGVSLEFRIWGLGFQEHIPDATRNDLDIVLTVSISATIMCYE